MLTRCPAAPTTDRPSLLVRSWVSLGFGSGVGARSPGWPGRRAARAPAPSGPEARRRAKPIRRAERSQSPAPSEANPATRGAERTRACKKGALSFGNIRRVGPDRRRRRRPKPIPRRRPKPIPGAERSQFPAPTEADSRRRANPGVRLRFAAVRLRAGRGRDARPRAARDRIAKGHPISSYLGGPAFSESAAGCESALRPGRPGAGISGLKRTHCPWLPSLEPPPHVSTISVCVQ